MRKIKFLFKFFAVVFVIFRILDFFAWLDRPFDSRPSYDVLGYEGYLKVVRLNLYKHRPSDLYWLRRSVLKHRRPVFTTIDPNVIEAFFKRLSLRGKPGRTKRTARFLVEAELMRGLPAGYLTEVYPRTAMVTPFPAKFDFFPEGRPCGEFLVFLSEHDLLPEGCVLDEEWEYDLDYLSRQPTFDSLSEALGESPSTNGTRP